MAAQASAVINKPADEKTSANSASSEAYRLKTAQRDSEAAQDTISELTLRLRQAEEARTASAARLAEVEARLAAAEAAGALAEAAAAAAEVLASSGAALPAGHGGMSPFQLRATTRPHIQRMLDARPGHATLLPGAPSINASLCGATVAAAAASVRTSSASMAALAWPGLAWGALAVLVYLRGRRVAGEAEARLRARLKEVSFALDAAEQSLALLESELQRRMKQLEEAQLRASDAGELMRGCGCAMQGRGRI